MSLTIPSSYTTANTLAGADGSSRLPMKTLDQNDFLKLLVTQMTSQDPMNPKTDMDFAAQMAQFTTLEQSRYMQADMSAMRGQQEILQANAMIGRTVELQIDNQTTGTGVVDGVVMSSGTPQIVVNGIPFDLSQVLAITPTPVNP